MNEIELKLDRKIIEDQIEATIKEMAEIYQMEEVVNKLKIEKTRGWADGSSRVGLTNSCEALESIFIPYKSSNYFRNKFWTGELIDLSIIRDTLKYLLVDYKADPAVNGTYGLSGTPYIDFRLKGEDADQIQSGIGKNYDFLDAAAFMITTLLDARFIDLDQEVLLDKGIITVKQDPLIPEKLLKEWGERVRNAFIVFKECNTGIGGGWSYTNDAAENKNEDYLYFSWNALETLDVIKEYVRDFPLACPIEVLENVTGSDLATYVNSLSLDKLSWLTSRFLSELDNKDHFIPKRLIKFGDDGNPSIYYNLFALISLMIVESADVDHIKNALTNVIKWYVEDKSDLKRSLKSDIYGEFILEGINFEKHAKRWNERAFNPLLLKAIANYIGKYTANITSLIMDISPNFETLDSLINYSLSLLQNCKCSHAKDRSYNNIWDSAWGPSKSEYSVYYTQRVIESLCAVYRYYYPNDVPQFRLINKESVKSVAPASAAVSIAPQVIVNINGEVLSEAVKAEILAGIRNEIANITENAKAVLETQLREAADKIVKESIGELVEEYISNTLEYIQNNLTAEEPDKKYINLAERMTKISGHCLSEIIYEAMRSTNHKGVKNIEKNTFKERFNTLFAYLVDMEIKKLPDVLDYAQLMSKLEKGDTDGSFFKYMKMGGKKGD